MNKGSFINYFFIPFKNLVLLFQVPLIFSLFHFMIIPIFMCYFFAHQRCPCSHLCLSVSLQYSCHTYCGESPSTLVDRQHHCQSFPCCMHQTSLCIARHLDSPFIHLLTCYCAYSLICFVRCLQLLELLIVPCSSCSTLITI